MNWLIEAALRNGLLVVIVLLALALLRVKSLQVQSCVWRILLFASFAMPALQNFRLPLPSTKVSLILPSTISAITALPTHYLDATPQRLAKVHFGLRSSLLLIYLTVGSVLLARVAMGLVFGIKLCRRAGKLFDAQGTDNVRISRDIQSPVVFGRMILLPVGCATWTAQTMSAVLAHERSHLRHQDFLILLAASVYRAVFWFNPTAWWLLRKLAILAELRSDDASISMLGGPRPYMEILSNIAGNGRGISMSIPMASTGTLRQRLHRMETWRRSPTRSSSKVWLLSALATGGIILGVAEVGHPGATDRIPGALVETAATIAQRRYDQARPRQAVPLEPAKLDHWVGSYRMSPFAAMTVSSVGGHVYAQITGQQRVEVFPDPEGELFYAANPFQLTFTGSTDAPAPNLILHQNGNERTGSRLTRDAAASLALRFAARLHDNRPQAGSASALQKVLTEWLDDADLSPALAALIRLHQPSMQEELRKAGPLKTIRFAGVGRGGWDVYDVQYEKAKIRARIVMGDQDCVDGLTLQYLP